MTEVLERLRSALADRYGVERELGQGGMATVYLAQDLKHHRPVAVKVLRPDLAATLGPERFLREIEIAATLQHPNILAVYDSGEAAGFLYYVMPYVEGHSLRERLSEHGELPVTEAVRILRDLADALAYAHGRGVLHRDIKPENIMLSGRHALVADFGVAKAVSEATGRQRLTTMGVALGTPTYMAPEQAAADPHMDHRADVYAFGVLAYELLAGRPPFTGVTPQAILAAHMTESAAPVSGLRPTLPQPLAQLVMRCLEKKPADRPQSAEELLPILESLSTSSGGITPAYTQPVAKVSGTRRRRVAVALGVLSLAAIAVVLMTVRLLGARLPAITVSGIAEVTTEPGVEFQPAISPDGKEVAYVAGPIAMPHLRVRSAAGIAGSAEVSLGQQAFSSQWLPSWNTDGNLVGFWGCNRRDCRDFAWYEIPKLGGAPRPATELPAESRSAYFAASPDGSRLAYPRGDTLFQCTVAPARCELLALHNEASHDLYSLAWSPDNKWLAYVNGPAEGLYGGNVSTTSLWVVAAAGGQPQRVATDEHLNVSPAWLDSRHLLFVSDRDGQRSVYVTAIGSKGARGEPRAVPGITDPHSISYSVTARKLAWARFTVRQNIWAYPLGQSRTLSIAAGTAVTSGSHVIEAHDVSPDGRWLAFDDNPRENMDLFRMPVAGGAAIAVTELPRDEFQPRWSPDGTEIAFYGHSPACPDSVTEILVVSASGGMPRTVTCSRSYQTRPSWWLDGHSLAYASGETGQRDIWSVARDSVTGSWGQPVQLTDSGIVMQTTEPDGSGVLGSAADGSELLVIGPDRQVVWRRSLRADGLTCSVVGAARYSRDGRTILLGCVHRDGREGIWAIPVAGGLPRLVIAFDDPRFDAAFGGFISVGPDRLYLTVSEYESNIMVANLRY